KLERAIQSYMKGTVDLRSGAIMAGVSYNHFMYEVESRNIVILGEDGFFDRLEFLAETFNNETLRDAIERIRYEDNTTDTTDAKYESRADPLPA
ncbi:MAG: hypothetical protein AAF639_41440, partial [Chloroflexota bacterium]